MRFSLSTPFWAYCLIFNNNINNSPPSLLIPLLKIMDVIMVSHMDCCSSLTNWSECFHSWSLGCSQLSTQDPVTCQIMSPIRSNHPMSFCFTQSKNQSPNTRLGDSVSNSTPPHTPHFFLVQFIISHPAPCFRHTGLLAIAQIHLLCHFRSSILAVPQLVPPIHKLS